MSETIDVQARDELYREITRAKEAETKLHFEIEELKEQLADLKAKVITETDDAPTYGSGNLVTSGVVYESLMSLSKRIDALR